MIHVLNKFKLMRPIWIVGLIGFGSSRNEEERTPLSIVKDAWEFYLDSMVPNSKSVEQN